MHLGQGDTCLLYTSDAADDLTRVDLGARRIIRKKKETLFLQRRVVTVSTKIPGTAALPATATMAFRWIDRDGIYISVIRKRESIFLLPGTLFRRIWTTTNVGMV